MKLRIKGNSLRLRVTRPELQRLLAEGRIEETVRFGQQEAACLIYALEHGAQDEALSVRYAAGEVAVALSADAMLQWTETGQVGVYGQISLGAHGSLEIAVEKDFACLDGDDAENADAFPNPRAGAVC